MTTETNDATQSGVPNDSETTPEPTAREIAMEAIANQRQGEFDAENRGEQHKPGSVTASQDDQIAAQLGDKEPANLDDQVVKVKIDGVESEVTVSEMRRQYQKNGAAERRLEEATKLLNEARAAAQSATPPVGVVQDDKKLDSDVEGEAKALLEALFSGDESKALEELKRFRTGRGDQTPTLDVDQIAAQLTPAIRQQLFVESALEKFAGDFPDIVADTHLADLADMFLDAEVKAGTPYDQALEQAGLRTRDWLSSKGVTTHQPNPTIDRNTKLERKAGIDKIPALNSKATTVEVPEPSASDVIKEMRRARGLEV